MDPQSSEAAEVTSRLNEERARLQGQLDALDKEIDEDGQISLSGDSASETTAADTRQGLRASLEHQLGEVEAALERVTDGTYGIDEVTGEPINPERLEAIPTARTNVRD